MKSNALSFAQSESTVDEYIPYSSHVTETIVQTKDGDFVSVFKLDGRSALGASQEDVFDWAENLNKQLSGVVSPHVSFWSHVIRRRVTEYPDSQFDNEFCRAIDNKYRETFTGINLMVNDIYLSVVYRPVIDGITSFFGALERQSAKEKKERQLDCIKSLDQINGVLLSSLSRRYGAELLGLEERNGYMFSRAGEFFAYLVNHETMKVPVTRRRLSEIISINRPHFSPTSYVGQMASLSGNSYFGMLDIFDYPTNTEPGQLNTLLEAEFEFVLTQSMTVLSRTASLGFLDRQQISLEDAKDHAESQILDLDVAKDLIASGQAFGGHHNATLTVIGESIPAIEKHLSRAREMLADVSIIAKPIDSALEAGFWSQLPSNAKWRPRPSFITSRNFLSFSSFHNLLSGKPSGNPWGEAVTILKTPSKTPLYLNFHYSNEGVDATDKKLLGNTMITGMSGTGKTVLLNFLTAQAQKLRPTVVSFDKDRGLEAAIRLMGGRYQALKNGVPTGLNPFQLEPTPANMAFLRRWVKALAAESGEVTHSDEVEIDDALHVLMMEMPKHLRRMTVLLQSLPNPVDRQGGAATVHARLKKWTEALGWVFDNPTDVIDLSTHRIYGFDLTDFLDNPETRRALMMYLIYRTESMIDGRRFMYMFDEFWKPLEDPDFQDLVKNKQKTIRKQNGLCVFSTQEVEDMASSPIASTLISQCATQIFLPNPRANRKTYMEVLKLTAAEFEVLIGLGEDSREFMIKQNGSCAVAKLDLGTAFDDELFALSGTPEIAELSEALATEFGEHPDNWAQEFFRRARILTKGK